MSLFTPAEHARFSRDGFLVVPALFDADEIAELAAAFERLADTAQTLRETTMVRGAQFVVEPRAEDVRIHRVVWCGAAEPVLSRYGMDARLVERVAELLGSRVMEQLINQAHFKLPGDGVDFAWHQDSGHRRYGTPLWTDVNGRGSYIQSGVAIDPMRPDNGPLKFIPGSHRRGHIPTPPGSRVLPEDAVDVARARIVALDPGDAVFFGPYVIHGSGPNTSAGPRRLFINGYAYPGANRRVYPGEGAGRRLEARRAELTAGSRLESRDSA